MILRAVLVLICIAGNALADGKTFTLAAGEGVAETGILDYLVPRFALKHGVRPKVVSDVAGADLVIAEQRVVEGLAGAVDAQPVFFTDDGAPSTFAMARLDGGNPDHAQAFADWLTSEIGQKTVATYAPDDGTVFHPGAREVEVETAVEVDGDADAGEKLALFHCGRCHVVSEKNRMGGIGSTPSFAALRAIPDWENRFLSFWSENPHPSFTQVEGMTEPFDPARPPHIAPVEITLDDIDAIFAFAATIEPKDLGAPIDSR